MNKFVMIKHKFKRNLNSSVKIKSLDVKTNIEFIKYYNKLVKIINNDYNFRIKDENNVYKYNVDRNNLNIQIDDSIKTKVVELFTLIEIIKENRHKNRKYF